MKAYEETDALRPTQVEGVPLAQFVKTFELHDVATTPKRSLLYGLKFVGCHRISFLGMRSNAVGT